VNIKNVERKGQGRVHQIRKVMEDGTRIMLCGIVQQEPFHPTTMNRCSYGEWVKTDEPVTCHKCLDVIRATKARSISTSIQQQVDLVNEL